VLNSDSNARSTKTRIETCLDFPIFLHDFIRMQDPLKQGLKLDIMDECMTKNKIRMQDPLKQGLKLDRFGRFGKDRKIRMQDPLKQGLKQKRFETCSDCQGIRMQDPLKQGLKLVVVLLSCRLTRFECKIH